MTSRQVTIAGYLAVAVGAAALQLAAHRDGSRVPSLGEVHGYLMRSRQGRVGVLLAWWWIGWHFFAR